ncbi:MAG: hypothetical protein ACKVW3_05935 [Phycisphaerales bacterium]
MLAEAVPAAAPSMRVALEVIDRVGGRNAARRIVAGTPSSTAPRSIAAIWASAATIGLAFGIADAAAKATSANNTKRLPDPPR